MSRARLFVVFAAVLMSTAGVVIKLSGMTAWQISSGRSLVAALALFAFLPEARRIPSKRGLLIAAAYAVSVSLFVIATRLTTAANAIFLMDTAPLYVLLLSVFALRERPTRSELFAAPVFLIGLGLFFLDQLAPGQRAGNLVALVAGAAYGSLIVGLRWIPKEAPSVLATGNLIAGVAVLPLAVTGPMPSALDFAVLLHLGLFVLALAYVFLSRGLQKISAVEGSLLVLVEPVLSACWTWLLAGERMGRWAMLGASVILIATIVNTLRPSGAPALRPSVDAQS